MWINKNEYDRLKDCEAIKAELEEEVSRLAELISAEVKDCKIGPWCENCRYRGVDRAILSAYTPISGWSYVKETAGVVQYCKKHLSEICPEFEMKV